MAKHVGNTTDVVIAPSDVAGSTALHNGAIGAPGPRPPSSRLQGAPKFSITKIIGHIIIQQIRCKLLPGLNKH